MAEDMDGEYGESSEEKEDGVILGVQGEIEGGKFEIEGKQVITDTFANKDLFEDEQKSSSPPLVTSNKDSPRSNSSDFKKEEFDSNPVLDFHKIQSSEPTHAPPMHSPLDLMNKADSRHPDLKPEKMESKDGLRHMLEENKLD